MIGVCEGPCCGDGVGDGGAWIKPGLLEGCDEFFEESRFVSEERAAAGDIKEEGVGERQGIESDDGCEAAEWFAEVDEIEAILGWEPGDEVDGLWRSIFGGGAFVWWNDGCGEAAGFGEWQSGADSLVPCGFVDGDDGGSGFGGRKG